MAAVITTREIDSVVLVASGVPLERVAACEAPDQDATGEVVQSGGRHMQQTTEVIVPDAMEAYQDAHTEKSMAQSIDSLKQQLAAEKTWARAARKSEGAAKKAQRATMESNNELRGAYDDTDNELAKVRCENGALLQLLVVTTGALSAEAADREAAAQRRAAEEELRAELGDLRELLVGEWAKEALLRPGYLEARAKAMLELMADARRAREERLARARAEVSEAEARRAEAEAKKALASARVEVEAETSPTFFSPMLNATVRSARYVVPGPRLTPHLAGARPAHRAGHRHGLPQREGATRRHRLQKIRRLTFQGAGQQHCAP